MEGRDGVEELGPDTSGARLEQDVLEGDDIKSVLVDWNLKQVCLGIAECLEGTNECRCLNQHGVPGVDDKVGHEVDSL